MDKQKKVTPEQEELIESKKEVLFEFMCAKLERDRTQASKNYKIAMEKGNLNEAATHLEEKLRVEMASLGLQLLLLSSMGEVNEDEANKIKEIIDAFNRELENVDEAKKNYDEAIKRNDSYKADRYLFDESTHLGGALDRVRELNSVIANIKRN